MSMLDSHEHVDNERGGAAAEERSAKVAVICFPLVILVGAVIAYLSPETFVGFKPLVNPMLMLIMFSMGLTITLPDLGEVARRPLPIIAGVACQFIVMPVSALLISRALGFNEAITFGLILLGSVPGGTASNVIAYLAKGDVALSVAMTSVSTLVSPLATPALMVLLTGRSAELNAAGMTISLLKVVLVPVLAGLALRWLAGKVVDRILPALPWISIAVIGFVMVIVVSGARDKLAVVGLVVVAGVALQNVIGFVFGYVSAKLLKEDEPACRTTSIEVATQNSGLAAAMSAQFYSPEAALPGAIAAMYANVSGAIFAAIMRHRHRAV